MKLQFALLLAALPVCAADVPASPDPLRFIHPRAGFIAGMNWRGMADSEFARVLKRELPGRSKTTGDMKFILSFDSAVISGPLPPAGEKATREGLVVVRGRFDVAELRRSAKTQGGQIQRYDGLELMTVQGASVAVVDETTLLIGDRPSVTAALRDRFRLPLDTEFTLRARDLAAKASAWMLADGPVESPQFRGIRGMSAAVTVHRAADIAVQLEAEDPVQAAALSTMLSMTMGAQAGAARMKTAVEGASIRLTASIAPEEIRSAMQAMGRQMVSQLAAAGLPVPQDSPAPVVPEEPPLPPEKQVIRIHGLEEGVREIRMTRP